MTFKDLKRDIILSAKENNEAAKKALHDLKELYSKKCVYKFFTEDQLLSECALELTEQYRVTMNSLPKELEKYRYTYAKYISTLKKYIISHVSLNVLQDFIEKSKIDDFEKMREEVAIMFGTKVRWADFIIAWDMLNLGDLKNV